ncbi:MAG TPA: MBL fold metallo-hydrolase [bacterium]|nr:MBL fold metallo-hydrolase [bacterium]
MQTAPQLAPLHLPPIAVGELGVVRLVDSIEHFSPRAILRGVTYEHLEPHLDWLRPHFLDEQNKLLMPIQSFVFRTRHHTVLIDTCVGNDKRSGFKQWNGRHSPFLDTMRAAGFPPESIDYVFCTHLHVDHAGWNTRLEDGRWVPTFPNARYLFRREEYDHWQAHPDELFRWTFEESVHPVVEAGRVDWVGADFQLDDQVTLERTPGHTPGHTSVHLHSGGREAVITGDLMVSPVEVAEPQWGQVGDQDHAQAVRTRTRFLDTYCDTDVLILGSHFADPTAVHIVSTPRGRRVRF